MDMYFLGKNYLFNQDLLIRLSSNWILYSFKSNGKILKVIIKDLLEEIIEKPSEMKDWTQIPELKPFFISDGIFIKRNNKMGMKPDKLIKKISKLVRKNKNIYPRINEEKGFNLKENK